MVNEIITAFLGPLPLSRRPKSKPVTPVMGVMRWKPALQLCPSSYVVAGPGQNMILKPSAEPATTRQNLERAGSLRRSKARRPVPTAPRGAERAPAARPVAARRHVVQRRGVAVRVGAV